MRRLVSCRHELHMGLLQRGLRRCIELSDHLSSHLPKERQIPLWVLTPDILNECADAILKAFVLDLPELC